jgi:uncharacterized membrane protein YebE (DUF533 family)
LDLSFGNIIGQMLEQGLGGQTQGRTRVANSAQSIGAQGGIEGILGSLQGALGGQGGAGGALGGFADMAKEFLRKDQVGGLSGGQVGGIGALAGAVLGGGAGGAVRGGAMAVLGTLALSALKNAKARAEQNVSAEDVTLAPADVAGINGPETERLMLRAMISAAKADGQIDQAEMEKIIGKASADGVTEEEKAFVMAELRAPVDLAALAAEVRSPAQAAEVYAASLLALDVDTDAERAYLRQLGAALRLDGAAISELHRMTGAPTV